MTTQLANAPRGLMMREPTGFVLIDELMQSCVEAEEAQCPTVSSVSAPLLSGAVYRAGD